MIVAECSHLKIKQAKSEIFEGSVIRCIRRLEVLLCVSGGVEGGLVTMWNGMQRTRSWQDVDMCGRGCVCMKVLPYHRRRRAAAYLHADMYVLPVRVHASIARLTYENWSTTTDTCVCVRLCMCVATGAGMSACPRVQDYWQRRAWAKVYRGLQNDETRHCFCCLPLPLVE